MHYMLETYEVAMKLCGLDPDNDDQFNDSDKVDEILYEKYGIEDTDGLDRLIKDLAKMADVGESPLTGEQYRGFGEDSLWLYKTKA